MKKSIILTVLCSVLFCVESPAQSSFKQFIGDMTLDLSVGATWGRYNKVWDQQKYGFRMGVDVSKPITTFKGSRSSLYGLVGVHLLQKSGSRTGYIDVDLDKGETLVANRLSVPINIGYRYSFSKCSLFVRTGPYVSFGISEGDNNADDVEVSSTEFGVGLDFGIKFRRFAFTFGLDQSLTKLASCDEENSLKAMTPHLMLSWSIGK